MLAATDRRTSPEKAAVTEKNTPKSIANTVLAANMMSSFLPDAGCMSRGKFCEPSEDAVVAEWTK
jgi:hypothetical protein